jgi:hypothetical protein
MFSSEILEIVIGLIFIYLILSLLSSTINELIAGLIRLRGRDLRKSLVYMLYDGENLKIDFKKYFRRGRLLEVPPKGDGEENTIFKVYGSFTEHALFSKFQRNSDRKFPSYLSSAAFSKILYEIITSDYTKKSKSEIDDFIDELDGPLGKVLKQYWEEAGRNKKQFRKKLSEWYEEMQTRVTGWYKRRVQWILLAIGFVVAIAVNADTFSMVEKLSGDSKARKALVELAIKQSQQMGPEYFPENEPLLESDMEEVSEPLEYDSAEFQGASYEEIKALTEKTHEIINEQLSEVNNIMGMGWNSLIQSHSDAQEGGKSMFWWYWKKFFGLVLTAFAMSLGANFWFDLLQKVVKLRNSGGLPEKQNPDDQASKPKKTS